MSFEGNNLYGQYIDYSEKKKMAQGLHLTLYWERLQDHWSSGLFKNMILIFFNKKYQCICNANFEQLGPGFLTLSGTKWAVQSQKMARGLNYGI